MARNKGTFPFAANFQVKMQEALDPRAVVERKEQLIDKETWAYDGDTIYVYRGMLVGVAEERSVYILSDIDKILSTDYSGWVCIGSSIDAELSVDSSNAVQNQAVTRELDSIREQLIEKPNYDIIEGVTPPEGVTDLSAYATTQWVNEQEFAKSSDVVALEDRVKALELAIIEHVFNKEG